MRKQQNDELALELEKRDEAMYKILIDSDLFKW